ncbi:hypothetical protein C1752_01515 [Acaryochloris thomasi RCC1774]|uniref:Uncharacterized protein n=1 Tax=Acaryochloris thomasi RCC1774 TaxID=1764569 RepID=A0A2W1JS19_9CYAN|nr:hypothetical protein C1752_01515 [Acaryochloris thomasi RCC1774]
MTELGGTNPVFFWVDFMRFVPAINLALRFKTENCFHQSLCLFKVGNNQQTSVNIIAVQGLATSPELIEDSNLAVSEPYLR